MAKEETPKDITPIKRKGIDMSVKGLSKQYPFVLGYKDDTTDQYKSSHYIDLIIDNNKLSEYMDIPVSPYWRQYVEQYPEQQKIYTIWSFLQFPNEDTFGDIINHPGHKLGEEVKSTLATIYHYLPEQYKLYYKHQSVVFPDDPPKDYPVNLRVNGYIMK
jgi:hypothetical protein